MNRLTRFFLVFFVVYICLALLHMWTPVQQMHLRFFMVVEQSIFNVINRHVHTRFIPFVPDPEIPQTEEFHFSIQIFDQLNWNQRYQTRIMPNYQLNQNLKVASIFQMLFFVALIAATPVSWRRRLVGLSIGIILIYLIIAMKFTNLIYERAEFLQNRSWTLWQGLSDLIAPALRSHEALLIFILGIWILVSFRRRDLQNFIK